MSDSAYWLRVRDRADELGADGCTCGSAAMRNCCLRHDVHYRTHQHMDGRPITQREADDQFLACMQARSIVGWWSPLGWFRYAVVRLFGAPRYAERKAAPQ